MALSRSPRHCTIGAGAGAACVVGKERLVILQ